MKITNVSELMDFENGIISEMGYFGGGYYKEQEDNIEIYNKLKDELKKQDLSWFKRRDYKILEDNNFHSLNALIEDIKEEVKRK